MVWVKNVTLDNAVQYCFSQCFVVVAAVALVVVVVGLKESAATIPMWHETSSNVSKVPLIQRYPTF